MKKGCGWAIIKKRMDKRDIDSAWRRFQQREINRWENMDHHFVPFMIGPKNPGRCTTRGCGRTDAH